MTSKLNDAAKALDELDLRQLKAMREHVDELIEIRAAAVANANPDYARAVRECLIDCEAFLVSARQGKLRHEHMGQLDSVLRDMRNLVNREDVEAYNYKKPT